MKVNNVNQQSEAWHARPAQVALDALNSSRHQGLSQSEIGHISRMLAEVQELTTPLLRQMAVFGQWLNGAIRRRLPVMDARGSVTVICSGQCQCQ